jgi:ABC-type thiamine transport system ATPase subunit
MAGLGFNPCLYILKAENGSSNRLVAAATDKRQPQRTSGSGNQQVAAAYIFIVLYFVHLLAFA